MSDKEGDEGHRDENRGSQFRQCKFPSQASFFINGATNDLKPSHNDTSISLLLFSQRHGPSAYSLHVQSTYTRNLISSPTLQFLVEGSSDFTPRHFFSLPQVPAAEGCQFYADQMKILTTATFFVALLWRSYIPQNGSPCSSLMLDTMVRHLIDIPS